VKQPRNPLGRGLAALIPTPRPEPEKKQDGPQREFFRCPIELISPSDDQPRKQADPERLQELAESIKHQGLIQPLVLRKEGERYVLIAGERRWRAAQVAGLREVPAIVRETSKREAFELALVENLQREDLNPLEEAEAYARLQEEFQYTQETLAARVGKERSTVANSLGLLTLDEPIRAMLAQGKLTAGHARPLRSIPDAELRIKAANEIVDRELSVRQAEALAKRYKESMKPDAKKPAITDGANVRALTDELVRIFGTKVNIRDRGPDRGGKIEIDYKSYQELDRILAIFRKEE
jgi:ParB family transcriptional regulator, chromosome partitioning protein